MKAISKMKAAWVTRFLIFTLFVGFTGMSGSAEACRVRVQGPYGGLHVVTDGSRDYCPRDGSLIWAAEYATAGHYCTYAPCTSWYSSPYTGFQWVQFR